MCGIAGIVRRSKIAQSELKSMTDAIKHRGPDGEGFWLNETSNVGLGHRRLSIIDLSSAGNQPMLYRDRFILIFNGEIYNYVELKNELAKSGVSFSSQSDTEVLLALYDKYQEDCLKYLDGMFAFSIYDNETGMLFCARDRFGEKPFYYHYDEGFHFVFASEMKALWAAGVNKKVSEKMLFNYLENGYVQNPEDLSDTFFAGIKKLKAAHYLKLDTRNCRIQDYKPYWNLTVRESNTIGDSAAAEKFRELFTGSVKRRLRSDVPVGSSLSGGLDSSLVVMTIDQLKKGTNQIQKTFSARFPGHLKDEGQYMQLVIDQCNVEPHFTFPKEEMILNDLDKIIYHQEEPFGSASICAQYEVMKLARLGGVTVLLDGQGADEVMAGYHNYFETYFKELKRKDHTAFEKERQNYLQRHQHSKINPVEKTSVRSLARQYGGLAFKIAKRVGKLVNPVFNKNFYNTYRNQVFQSKPEFDSLNDRLLWDTTWFGLEQLLRYADRNSMAHSLEVRLPFLNHSLVEFIFTLPSNFKIRDGWTKWIMREAYKNLLPQKIAWRKDKIGYEPPQDEWMTKKQIQEKIHECRKILIAEGILNKNILKHNLNGVSSWTRQQNDWSHLMAGSLFK